MNKLFLYSFLILALYILSGYDKTKDISGTATGLKNKTNLNLPMNLFTLAIIIVILLEVVGSLFILYSTYTDKHKVQAAYTTLALAGFTILATLIYHQPTSQKEYYAFLKNLGLIGGLLLLADTLNK